VRAAKQAVPGLLARRRIAVLTVAATAFLTACAGAPTRESASVPRGKSGGYYLDDGPGANPPANLDQIPDPQPKPELIKASTARPYTAFGRTYTPMTHLAPYRERGTASWYGKRYHGQPTASGELYDMYAMTAAHPTLPIPSYARVTNVRSGKSVIVRINDRGPFRGERLIDLSYTAAYKLGIIGSGSDLVEVESIVPAGAPAPTAVEADANRSLTPVAATQSEAPSTPPVIESPAQEPKGVYVQLGAFSQRPKAETFLAQVRTELNWLAGTIGLYLRDGVYRVHAGPYPDRTQADQIATRIEQSVDLRPVVITR
jgi:peptidoglycan lytic transglycosylase